MGRDEIDYALVGLTLDELTAVRDTMAREIDIRRRKQIRVPPAYLTAYEKIDYYRTARAERIYGAQ